MPDPSADAIARLKHMTAADKEPKLTDADITELLTQYQRADRNGLVPTAAEWQETYDFNLAAAEGWRWKAGKAIGLNAVRSGDEQRFDPMHLQCMDMARTYERRAGGIRSIQVVAPSTLEPAP